MAKAPKVLLLGDSIRQSCQKAVKDILGKRAEVIGPAENCRHAAYTLDNLDRWLAELGTPDVVHWNNGLHDIGHNAARSPHQFPLDVYTANLRRIRERLRETGASIVWATTTPVRTDRVSTPDGWTWDNEEIVWYNATARELMDADDVKINDLHALVAGDRERFLSEDRVHLSDEGVAKCAQAVCAAAEEFI
jgi:lysophospholipase L1-like esterase